MEASPRPIASLIPAHSRSVDRSGLNLRVLPKHPTLDGTMTRGTETWAARDLSGLGRRAVYPCWRAGPPSGTRGVHGTLRSGERRRCTRSARTWRGVGPAIATWTGYVGRNFPAHARAAAVTSLGSLNARPAAVRATADVDSPNAPTRLVWNKEHSPSVECATVHVGVGLRDELPADVHSPNPSRARDHPRLPGSQHTAV